MSRARVAVTKIARAVCVPRSLPVELARRERRSRRSRRCTRPKAVRVRCCGMEPEPGRDRERAGGDQPAGGLPPLTERIGRGPAVALEFHRLMSQLLLVDADRRRFRYEAFDDNIGAFAGAPGAGALDGLAVDG